jgi:uncharacterized membrane protein YozB (DUF420 family)
MRKNRYPVFPIIILFVLVNGLIISGKNFLERKGFDQDVLFVANLILLALMLLSFYLTRKSFSSPNPQAFIRGVYTGMMIKFFVCIAAVLGYVVLSAQQFNKPSLLASLALYLVYTGVEVVSLTRLLRKKNA